MPFQPASNLRSRTFVGLLLSQFLAAFNDQAIHAAGMFFAINQQALTEAEAISLMPILFYLPWVLFGTVAGYFADRFSKQRSLVFWKAAEIGITLVAFAGFYMGSELNNPNGALVVLGTVFLMGTHSTFFVPAKYGVMPEILKPQLLSKGNGLLESLSFLAVILGTVSGGVLSYVFKGDEYIIGLILVGFAVVGAFASLLIENVPAADPSRRFPRSIYGPLVGNLRTMIRSRPLGLAVLGIAFFTFVVVFMRASVYMLGESQIPRWTEQETSIIVGMTALGIGLGSPLAGNLSGGKVEVGLIPLGGVGMILATFLAAAALDWLPNLVGLVAGLILIGFFTGFYIVPMFTLLQHRAPKASKGDLVATNNFISVTGAIAATVVFFGLDKAAERFHFAEPVEQRLVATGRLVALRYEDGRPRAFEVEDAAGGRREFAATDKYHVIHFAKKEWKFGLKMSSPEPGDEVDVGTYAIDKVTYTTGRPHAAGPLPPAYNKSHVPRYLFLGAAAITLFTLLLLRLRLPDLFLRSVVWRRSLGRRRLKVEGVANLPSDGPVLLLTNCRRAQSCLEVLAATDRHTRIVFVEDPKEALPPLARWLFLRPARLAVLTPGDEQGKERALTRAARALTRDKVVLVPGIDDPALARFAEEVQRRAKAVVVPVFCDGDAGEMRRVRVAFGEALEAGTSPEAAAAAIRRIGADQPEAAVR